MIVFAEVNCFFIHTVFLTDANLLFTKLYTALQAEGII